MAKAKSKMDLTPHQLEQAKKELIRMEQEKQADFQERQRKCLDEIEKICDKYNLVIRAPISKNNILELTAKLFENPNSIFSASIILVDKPE